MSIADKPIAAPRLGKSPGRAAVPRVVGRVMRSNEKSDPGGIKLLVYAVTRVHPEHRGEMLARIKKGLKFNCISQLEEAFGVSQKDIAHLLSIPVSTLARRKREGRLHADESDRVVRLARLKDETLALMGGDNDAAVAWLRTPLNVLGGESPLQHASTELGARDVEDLIGRIRQGVFS